MSTGTNTQALDERSKGVLQSVIQIHIATGEPVGSEAVCRVLNRSMSPATIRAIMADLERGGYLDHPHTSAGRMPTDEGYRVYVNGLMREEPLTPGDAAAIDQSLRAGSPSQVLVSASQILSRLSHNIGFVLAPDIAQTSFMHIDLVRLAPPRILVVMVSRSGIVTHRVIEIGEPLAQDELQTCANYLNAHFTGMNLIAIRGRLLEMMREEKALYDSLLKQVISVAEQAFAPEESGASVYLDGASNIVGRPEFEDIEKMRALFKTFEEKGRLVKILNECMHGEGIRILIGHENPDPDLHGVSVIATSAPVGGETGWGLGVLGSTRMEYPRIVAIVDHMARSIGRALTDTQ
jgi:heat-inducible transcriptional repressor